MFYNDVHADGAFKQLIRSAMVRKLNALVKLGNKEINKERKKVKFEGSCGKKKIKL